MKEFEYFKFQISLGWRARQHWAKTLWSLLKWTISWQLCLLCQFTISFFHHKSESEILTRLIFLFFHFLTFYYNNNYWLSFFFFFVAIRNLQQFISFFQHFIAAFSINFTQLGNNPINLSTKSMAKYMLKAKEIFTFWKSRKGTIEWSFLNIFVQPWVQSSIHLWVSDKHTDITRSENWILEVLDDNHVICSHFVD